MNLTAEVQEVLKNIPDIGPASPDFNFPAGKYGGAFAEYSWQLCGKNMIGAGLKKKDGESTKFFISPTPTFRISNKMG